MVDAVGTGLFLCQQVLLLQSLEGGKPLSVLSLAPLPAVKEVVGVGYSHFLGLVPRESDGAAHLWRGRALVAALFQEAINRLDFVPALLLGDLREVGGGLLYAPLGVEL